MTEDRSRQIALAMEPVIRDMHSGADAAVAAALSPGAEVVELPKRKA